MGRANQTGTGREQRSGERGRNLAVEGRKMGELLVGGKKKKYGVARSGGGEMEEVVGTLGNGTQCKSNGEFPGDGERASPGQEQKKKFRRGGKNAVD